MMLTFDAEKHSYSVDEKKIPSVTQVIGEWRKINVYGSDYVYNRFTGTVLAAEKFVGAGDYGRAVHDLMRIITERAYGMGLLPADVLDFEKLHPSLYHPAAEFFQFLQDHQPEVYLVETPLMSKTMMFAGTPDLVLKVGKRLWMVDVKTGGYEAAGIQLAAYEFLYRGNYNVRLPFDRFALVLPDKGPYKLVPFKGLRDWPMFNALLIEHNYINGGRK